MTLTIAWIRKVGTVEELVIASDSRLRNGAAWDACPKIFPLPRNDSVIGFCGSTADAYPFILQMQHAISIHRASMNRSLDLSTSKSHFLKFLNDMRRHIHDLPRGQDLPDPPECKFVIAGYCWRSESFKMWQFRFDPTKRTFIEVPTQGIKGITGNKHLIILGDPNYTKKELAAMPQEPRHKDVKYEAYRRIVEMIQNRGTMNDDGFDMEPFEVIRDMIQNDDFPFVGGAPQLIKVYKYASTQRIAVYCPWLPGNKFTIMGRQMMPYERYEVPVINADTLQFETIETIQTRMKIDPGEG